MDINEVEKAFVAILIVYIAVIVFLIGTLSGVREELRETRNKAEEYRTELEETMKTMAQKDERIKELEAEAEEKEKAQASKTLYEQSTPTQSTNEAEVVKRVIAAEARGCNLEGQMAVAQTILDRATYWNMTPLEVVSQPSQYAAPYYGAISELTEEAYERVFVNGERVFDCPTTHFYNYTVCSPTWAEKKTESGIIGVHRFMY